MGRLMEIAICVMEGQDRHNEVEGAALSQEFGSIKEALSPCIVPNKNLELSNDIDDINDQSILGLSIALDTEERRLFFRAEDLEQFACSGQIVPVYLEAIGEAILMVADNAPPADGLFSRGYMIYRVSEWWALFGITPKHFRFLHSVKKLFGGEIERDEEEPWSD